MWTAWTETATILIKTTDMDPSKNNRLLVPNNGAGRRLDIRTPAGPNGSAAEQHEPAF
jgi:hypothetical protein